MTTMASSKGVFIEQFVDENLGNSSYLVGSVDSGKAAVIDPPRHVAAHLAAAKARQVEITHVLESHLHNDFISGALEIGSRTGAIVGTSHAGGVEFDHQPLSEGDRISLGGADLAVLATPGHTPEHLSFALSSDGAAKTTALFSGGALIVGGAARTDLLGPDQTEPLAHQLFQTLHGKILTLPATVKVYPTHGAGSFCAAPASAERVTTIGREKDTNPLARASSETEFVRLATTGLPAYPTYFKEMRPINRRGPRLLRDLPSPVALSPEEVSRWSQAGGAVLDVRVPEAFRDVHVPGAYGLALVPPLTTWAGWLIPFGTALVVVSETKGEREDALAQLTTIGYDDVRGYLEGGMRAWIAAGFPTERTTTITREKLLARMASPQPPLVVDVREDSEWNAGHLPGTVHVRNGRLPWEENLLPRDRPIILHCAHANRATAAASVLARNGYRDLTVLTGGFEGWRDAGLEVVRDSPGDR